jgi:hypothetical protein
MEELQASRTLVKSPPELWAECSDAASLARHLDRFGEIRITRLEPETAVAWEGERARGTVRIEPSGWGTKVILTAVADDEEAPPVPVTVQPEPEPEPEEPEAPAVVPAPFAEAPAEEPPPERRRRFARLRAFLRGPEPAAEPPPDDPPARLAIEEPVAVEVSPQVPEESPPEPDSPEPVVSDTEAALTAALDSLGQAHHRPYSRA